GYWPMNENEGTAVLDFSPNGNNGALVNMDAVTDRGWSGASIGDASAGDYDADAGFSASLGHEDGDNVTATATSGTISGVQVYMANDDPMRTGATADETYIVYPHRYW